MFKNLPTLPKLREDTIKELKRIKNLNKIKIPSNPKKRKIDEKESGKDNVQNPENKNNISQNPTMENFNQTKKKKKKTRNTKRRKNKTFIRKTSLDKNTQYNLVSVEDLMEPNIQKEDNNQENIEIDDYNELPYTQAIIYDKRNVFQIFKSLIIKKFDLINILTGDGKIKIIMIGEYILSLLVNFFFNALLSSDEVVSNKYHNNGQLDFIVTLILSLLI